MCETYEQLVQHSPQRTGETNYSSRLHAASAPQATTCPDEDIPRYLISYVLRRRYAVAIHLMATA